jgi:hypothetical protein
MERGRSWEGEAYCGRGDRSTAGAGAHTRSTSRDKTRRVLELRREIHWPLCCEENRLRTECLRLDQSHPTLSVEYDEVSHACQSYLDIFSRA